MGCDDEQSEYRRRIKIKMNIRVLYNVLLVRLGIRQILPSDYINGIRVMENNDPMVQLQAEKDFIKIDGKSYLGRKGMIDRLLKAAKEVSKKDCRLRIYQIYRSPETQTNRRNELYEQLKQEYPDYEETEILHLLNIGIAGVGGGHQTGGSVDLGLCDQDGRDLDMGTKYLEHNAKTKTRCMALTEEQRSNRRVLVDAMQRAGFVNYPAEWWHFSYGDKMWAAYSSKKSALYDVYRQDTSL